MTLRLMLAMVTSSMMMTTMTTAMAISDSVLRQNRTVGPEVVKAVINEIQENCILPHSSQLLRRLAYVESRDGTATDTFRPDFHGGIWQVSQANFNQTKLSDFLQRIRSQIQSNFSIDWKTTSWSDLEKPLYSGLAAALYIADTLRDKSLPVETGAQENFWIENYHQGYLFSSIVRHLDTECQEQEDLDIAFILDTSSSISAEDFAHAQNFIIDTTSILDIDHGHTRVAVITFADDAYLQFSWEEARTHRALMDAIRRLTYKSGSTETAKALHLTRTAVFSHARHQAVKIAVLLTDGRPHDYLGAAQAANQLAADVPDIHLLAVGVGDQIDATELQQFATPPACRNTFSATGYDQLDAVKEEIYSIVCKANNGNAHNSCRNGDHKVCESVRSCICSNVDLATEFCPNTCGHCKVADLGDRCSKVDRETCNDLAPCICSDLELASEHCPHKCGFCNDTSSPNHSQTSRHTHTPHRTAPHITSTTATTTTATATSAAAATNKPATSTSAPKTTTEQPTTASEDTSPSTSSFHTSHAQGPKSTHAPPPPSRCMQCGDEKNQTPCTDGDLILGDATLCDVRTPYCMNDIYMSDGVPSHYRRCVNETVCYTQWFEGTSDKNLCVNFDPSVNVFDLACHLCCYGDGCNADDVPAKTTLYQP